ncbi:MAG: gliding motility-associated C-terminal domain-containing protein, partial [Desulfobacteraceae bacterium]|nr:gliding motility-associated C-terminal domain-containing protein [Desulfobacteraceae bacterium]
DGPTVNATFTPDADECATTTSVTINISDAVTPTFSFATDYCSTDASFSFPTTSDNGISGSWSPTSVNPATNGPTVNATFTPDADECATTSSVTINISDAVTPTFSFATDYCSTDASFSLPTTSDNGISGSWTPASVNPATDGPTVNATFTPDADDCATTTSVTINISDAVTPTFSFATDYCSTDAS